MRLEPSLLLRVLSAARGKPLSVQEIMQRGRIDPGAKQGVTLALRKLAGQRKVERQGKRWAAAGTGGERSSPAPAARSREQLAPSAVEGASAFQGQSPRGKRQPRSILGTLHRHPEGYGFVTPVEGGQDDVFLPPPEIKDAMDGDQIRIEIVRGRDGRSAGRLLEIVERRRTHLVGVYAARGKASFVVPVDRALPEVVHVRPFREAREGAVVNVHITRYPERGRAMEGVVERVVGVPGDPAIEILSVAQANGFADEFPPPALAEAESTPSEVHERDWLGRRDLRPLPLVTIDGEDARDFDDAVFVEPAPPGYRLVVAIADVAHYVRKGTALDGEALKRATSVYFPARAIPMLPERLSNGICSLNPGVDRLCMVADLLLDQDGRPLGLELYESVMRSAARLTYTEVARILGGERVPGREALAPNLELMGELALKMTRLREQRGSIDFDIPESKVVLDAEGRVSALARRERNLAHRLVEEFMLAANEAVARYCAQRGLPTVYRVHGEPDEEKLATFAAMARAHGFSLVPGEELRPVELNAFLKRIAGRPEQKPLNMLLLRAMMQALYSAQNIGHYGLAAPFYLHFTSPIRRYPDLMVHRLLKEHWARGGRLLSAADRARMEKELVAVAEQASERERAAMDAEREIQAYYSALFMKDKVGQEFGGLVAGVAEFGLFVELAEHAVEGLVRAEEIGQGAEYDEKALRLFFPRSGVSFAIGDRVRVLVKSADPGRRRVELALASGVSGSPIPPGRGHSAAPPGAHRRRGRRSRPPRSPRRTAQARPRPRSSAPAPRR